MPEHCPGAANIRGTPTLTIKKCPQCGAEAEVFSNDVSVRCDQCGFEIFNDIISCIRWCRYAKECVGEETYNRLMARQKEQGRETKNGPGQG
ncbi:MAG TPA: hypothetical protein VLY83_03700 [Methanoregula sp.]|nr:hypothetical protein [Methanoregula sp.]